MNLEELNERWRVTGKPHAISDDGELYQWHCPRCPETGVARVPLHAAMNDALHHLRTKHCEPLE